MKSFERLHRVTSDSRIWAPGGEVAWCESCGTAQKLMTPALREDIAQVYATYDLYFQGDGSEQKIFVDGVGLPRSSRLVQRVLGANPAIGDQAEVAWLDFGCGKGHLLRALSSLRPSWMLYGADLSERNRSYVESIPGFQTYWAGSTSAIDETFDVISLSHVLEHVGDPRTFLRELRDLLRPGGIIVIAVPDAKRNPFDLLVVDHVLHFTTSGLARLLSGAGFRDFVLDDRTLGKELLVTARRAEDVPQVVGESFNGTVASRTVELALADSVHWLESLVPWSQSVVDASTVGVFGTALAATWLHHTANCRFEFFVEEDRDRVGRSYLGRAVVFPTDVPPGAAVLVPLPGEVGERVCERLNQSPDRRYLPPPAAVSA